MKRLDELLADQSRVKSAASGVLDPELRSLVVSLGYKNAQANDPGGRVTDKDFSAGVQSNLGFDPDGKLLDRTKFWYNVGDVRALLRKRMAELPAQVNKSIAPLNDAAINGQGTRLLWDPVNLEAPTLKEPNAREAARNAADAAAPPTLNPAGTKLVPQHTVLQPTAPPPTTVKAYEKALSTEASDPAQRTYLLPEHDSAKVQDVIDFSKGRGPADIRRHAEEVLNTILPSKGPGVSSTVAELPPRERETARLIMTMRDDAAKRATKSIEDLSSAVERLNLVRQGIGRSGPLSADSIRNMAKTTYGLTDADDVIQAAIEKVGAK